jgi:dihydrofolate reductase
MGYKTWLTLKKPLPNRLNIVLSRREVTEPRESIAWMRDRLSVLSLKNYLNCDLFIIGGAQVFEMFREDIERWIVTEVPLAVEDADTFMHAGFLEGFDATGTLALEDDLKVTFYERRVAGD